MHSRVFLIKFLFKFLTFPLGVPPSGGSRPREVYGTERLCSVSCPDLFFVCFCQFFMAFVSADWQPPHKDLAFDA
jgi:hypothetical protein